jgi:predicted MFS family arabinose efflux permease
MHPAEAELARPLRLLGLAAFASMAAMRWCDALLPVLAAEFGRSTGQAAQVVYAFALAYGAMQLVYGPLGDRLGKFRVVSWAALACTLGALACALAPGLGWLTAARVLNGAAAAGIIPLAMAWIGDHVPWERRQAVLARLLGNVVIGMIAGQWLAGTFADTLGWRSGFVVVALLFAAAGVAMRLTLREVARLAPAGAAAATAESSLERMRQVLASTHARRILAVTAAEGACAFSAMAFAPSHLHGRFGLAVSAAGAVLALYGVGGLLYSRSVPWLLARMSPPAMARTGGVLAGLAWLLFALAPAWAWTLPLALLSGLGFYMIHNTLQMQATQMVPAQRGTAVSLFACALFLGQSAGTGVVSWMVDRLSTGAALGGCGVGLAVVGVVVGRTALAVGGEAARGQVMAGRTERSPGD